MCFAQGPQRSDAGEARTHGPSVSSQALYHWATALPSGCDLKLCDFIARQWTSIPDPGNNICLHCKRYYRDSLTHQLTECKCTKTLKDRFLCDCRGILPPELVDVLLTVDADTFVTIVLSASCWSNLDRAMVESFFFYLSRSHLSEAVVVTLANTYNRNAQCKKGLYLFKSEWSNVHIEGSRFTVSRFHKGNILLFF